MDAAGKKANTLEAQSKKSGMQSEILAAKKQFGSDSFELVTKGDLEGVKQNHAKHTETIKKCEEKIVQCEAVIACGGETSLSGTKVSA